MQVTTKQPVMARHWAMPNSDTFSIHAIGAFVMRYLMDSKVSVDPFARNKDWATHTNDLDPNTKAQSHQDAEAFLNGLDAKGVRADLVLFDPPYSPRQISECYKSVGLEVGMKETQSALLYKRVRDAAMPMLTPEAVVLSFGWNTVGMGKERGFELIEIMLVCHGGAHNDTICIAERRIRQEAMLPGIAAVPVIQKPMASSTTFDEMRNRIGQLYGPDRRWTLFEESMLGEIARQSKAQAELNIILRYRESMPPADRAKFFPQSVPRLLEKWNEILDRARMAPLNSTSPADKELDKLMRRCEKL